MAISSELFGLGVLGLMVVASLSVVLILKNKRIEYLQSSIDKLRKSFDDLDEQAKLIVKTDLELNKTQEELDKKVSGLYVLQKLSREISTTLEEGQIFKRIDAA